MNNNFTPRAQQVLNIARREADRFHHNYIGAEHVLLGLLKLGQGVAISVMENAGVDIAALTFKIEQSIVPGSSATEGSLPYTPRVRKMLIQAGEEARKLRHSENLTQVRCLSLKVHRKSDLEPLERKCVLKLLFQTIEKRHMMLNPVNFQPAFLPKLRISNFACHIYTLYIIPFAWAKIVKMCKQHKGKWHIPFLSKN